MREGVGSRAPVHTAALWALYHAAAQQYDCTACTAWHACAAQASHRPRARCPPSCPKCLLCQLGLCCRLQPIQPGIQLGHGLWAEAHCAGLLRLLDHLCQACRGWQERAQRGAGHCLGAGVCGGIHQGWCSTTGWDGMHESWPAGPGPGSLAGVLPAQHSLPGCGGGCNAG